MPLSVQHLLSSAGLVWHSAARWGVRPNLNMPGVYLVSTCLEPTAVEDPDPCRLSGDRIRDLLAVRPEMTVEGMPATSERLAAALRRMCPEGETVLYIGLAGTSVAGRVGKYYSTRLGARSPHAGGWPIKMLADLDNLYVHVAAAQQPAVAEAAALTAFMAGLSPSARAALSDPSLPLPFANLELSKGQRKRHGISGAKQPRDPSARQRVLPPKPTTAATASTARAGGSSYSLHVTAADLAAGRIRVTREPKHALGLPRFRTTLSICLRGEDMQAIWDPRIGTDRERSGVLQVGKSALARLSAHATLHIRSGAGGRIDID